MTDPGLQAPPGERDPVVVLPEQRPALRSRWGQIYGSIPWMMLAVMVLTAVARVKDITSAYDINGDEVDYTGLTLSIRHGTFPPTFDGVRFFLHPPLFFILGTGWDDALHVSGSILQQIYALRYMNAVLAVVTAGLIYTLGTRLAGRWAGAGAALLFAVDPYIIRQNGRAMLETCTMAFVVAGYLILSRLVDGEAKRARLTSLCAGLLLGLSVLANDIAAILVVVPLLLWFWRGGTPRRVTRIAFVASLVPYTVYVVVLAALGSFPEFWSQETYGLRRQLGLVQVTGFNQKGSPSLFTTVLDQLGSFGVTYALCALGIVAAIYLLVHDCSPAAKLWAVVTMAGAVSLAYSVLFGTVEEQMLYYMYVPAIVGVVAGLAEFCRSRPDRPSRFQWRHAAIGAVVIFALYNIGVWAYVRRSPNTGLSKVISWFQTYAPHPGPVGSSTAVTTLLLNRSGFHAFDVSDPEQAAAAHVRYITILSAELVGSYSSLSAAQAGFFEHYGKLVFRYRESTYGVVSIYETTAPSVW